MAELTVASSSSTSWPPYRARTHPYPRSLSLTEARGSSTNLSPSPYLPQRPSEPPCDLVCRQVALRPRPLPPLCACGLDPLDNHVQRCARNCLFHKNPAAYSRALSGLISRTIKLEAPPAVA